jgi:hypothetical protein
MQPDSESFGTNTKMKENLEAASPYREYLNEHIFTVGELT